MRYGIMVDLFKGMKIGFYTCSINKLDFYGGRAVTDGLLFLVRSLPSEDTAQRGRYGVSLWKTPHDEGVNWLFIPCFL